MLLLEVSTRMPVPLFSLHKLLCRGTFSSGWLDKSWEERKSYSTKIKTSEHPCRETLHAAGHTEATWRGCFRAGDTQALTERREIPRQLRFLFSPPLQSPGCKRALAEDVSADTSNVGKAEESSTYRPRDLAWQAGGGSAGQVPGRRQERAARRGGRACPGRGWRYAGRWMG